MLKTKVGDRFAALVVEDFECGKPMALKLAHFLCDCGKRKSIRLSHVTSGRTVSCGCAKRKHFVTAGQAFSRLRVLSPDVITKNGHTMVACACECGVEKHVDISDLVSGSIVSCGCYRNDRLRQASTIHDGDGTPIYSVWHSIKNRCLNPGVDGYHCYGGRGISVCPEWMSDFSAFRVWAEASGYSPELQIDRIDVNGNYTATNCRWVTSKVNGNNRRNNVLLNAFGETKTMSMWADDPVCAVSYSTLKQRIYKGKWPHELAISLPPQRR